MSAGLRQRACRLIGRRCEVGQCRRPCTAAKAAGAVYPACAGGNGKDLECCERSRRLLIIGNVLLVLILLVLLLLLVR